MPSRFNSIAVTRLQSKHTGRDTIFIPLPAGDREPIAGGCQCNYCRAHPEHPPMWDTLAINADAKSGERTWTVHAPEMHAGTRGLTFVRLG